MEVASRYKLLAHCLHCLVFTLLFKLPTLLQQLILFSVFTIQIVCKAAQTVACVPIYIIGKVRTLLEWAGEL